MRWKHECDYTPANRKMLCNPTAIFQSMTNPAVQPLRDFRAAPSRRRWKRRACRGIRDTHHRVDHTPHQPASSMSALTPRRDTWDLTAGMPLIDTGRPALNCYKVAA
jgi:hypothetical protein